MGEPGDGHFHVDLTRRGSAVVYRVRGEVDALTSPGLDSALTGGYDSAEPVAHVVLDLTDVPFLSSAGLSVLIVHHKRCSRDHVTFAVVATNRATLRAIQITALDRIIPVHDTVDSALAGVEAGRVDT